MTWRTLFAAILAAAVIPAGALIWIIADDAPADARPGILELFAIVGVAVMILFGLPANYILKRKGKTRLGHYVAAGSAAGLVPWLVLVIWGVSFAPPREMTLGFAARSAIAALLLASVGALAASIFWAIDVRSRTSSSAPHHIPD